MPCFVPVRFSSASNRNATKGAALSHVSGLVPGAWFLATAVCFAPAAAQATQIAPTSYDMPNGYGRASGGTYNYWDRGYTGVGATTTDGAPLSGGLGDLTDGVIASGPWYTVENAAGTGPYVGWWQGSTLNPTVTFHFAGVPTIDQIAIHMDNTNTSVSAPLAIWVDGVNQSFTPPPTGTIGFVTLSNLNLSGPSHTIQFYQNGGNATFVSEIQFFDNAVPEPATWAMMIAGFALTGATLRRRHSKKSVPTTP